MNAARSRGLRKATRTAAQIVASGGLTALVDAVADLSGTWKAVIAAGWMVAVTYAQNSLETAGAIPTLLPTPGVVLAVHEALPGPAPIVATTVGTVEAVATDTGNIVGEVTDTTGDMIGEVTGGIDTPDDAEDPPA